MHHHVGMFAPIVGNPFNPGAQAESGAAADTDLLLLPTTQMNRGSGHKMRKMKFPFLL
jgi:hypothetical protein